MPSAYSAVPILDSQRRHIPLVLFVGFLSIVLIKHTNAAPDGLHKMKTFMDTEIDNSLFGPASVTPAPKLDLEPDIHPRIVFSQVQWEALTSRYANSYYIPNSWSAHQSRRTLIRGPKSSFIERLSMLNTTAYKGDVEDLSIWNSRKRSRLKSLASEMINISDIESQALFMCAFWSSVNSKMAVGLEFLPGLTQQKCILATVSWAKVLLAHRAYNCASTCPSGVAASRAHLWDHTQRFVVSNDAWTLGLTLALAYDVLYNDMSISQRRTVRSAIAMLVMKKASWGNTVKSTVHSPNAAIHPHRIFSNWAPYHSTLYLTNLAIEGETDFDFYVQKVLNSEGETGFNDGLNFRFTAMLDAYMTHSIYPDGSTFEDGYTYFIAMIHGSLGLIAATRRGTNLLDTPRFRKFIHNAVQMTEPWHCGALLGHGAGGGISFPTYVALFRYVYPKGLLPTMMWRNRMGTNYEDNKPCRIDWYQHMMQITIMAREHDENITKAVSPQGLPMASRMQMPRSFYAPRRGLVMMRNNWRETSAYAHFDARPDAFIAGHDNADRGVFTFTALRQTWLTDLPVWNINVDSRKHSVMHVDGLAQGEFRTPGARIIKADDNGAVAIATANLTYAYNIHWFQSPQANPIRRDIIKYLPNGTETTVHGWFYDKEIGDPRSFGWPADDDGADIGMNRPGFQIWGDSDFGFNGIFIWKRNYRPETKFLERAIRSVGLIRSVGNPGYLLVLDSFKSTEEGQHEFESYLILHDDVAVETEASGCNQGKCIIVLKSGSKKLDVHVVSRNNVPLQYRTEAFVTGNKHFRVVIKAVAGRSVELWIGLNAHSPGTESTFRIGGVQTRAVMTVIYNDETRYFMVDKSTFSLTETNFVEPMAPVLLKRSKTMTRLGFRHLTDNVDTFIHNTRLTYQVVLQIQTEPAWEQRRERKVYEKISTCSGMSKRFAVSTIDVYDCGRRAIENYSRRMCERVQESVSRTRCYNPDAAGAMTLLFSADVLQPGMAYFVAVSITPTKNDSNPVVGLLHKRVRRRAPSSMVFGTHTLSGHVAQ